MVGRRTASAIASASMKSFLFDFTYGAHVLRRHQPDLMSLVDKSSSQKMRAGTGFHPDHVGLEISRVDEEMRSGELLLREHCTLLIESHEVKDGFRNIDTDGVNGHDRSPPERH